MRDSSFSDLQLVAFRGHDNISIEEFEKIMRLIQNRFGAPQAHLSANFNGRFGLRL